MYTFLILLLLALSQCNAHPRDKRLVGGKHDFKNQYPFLASFGSYNYLKHHSCGAAAITEYSLITAAHCIINKKWKNMVVYFEGSKTEHTIHKLMVHPGFNSSRPLKGNDIGIIELEKPLPIGTNIKTISLRIGITVRPGDKVIATGWKNKSLFPYPQYIEQSIMSDKECSWLLVKKVGREVICTSDCRTGASFGDSGSPLVYTNGGQSYIVGVTSWVATIYSSERECYLRLNVYSDVSFSLPWILNVLKTDTGTMASGDKIL